MSHQAYSAALQYYVDHGVDEALDDRPLDRRKLAQPRPAINAGTQGALQSAAPQPSAMPPPSTPSFTQQAANAPPPAAGFLGKTDARAEAVKLANQAATLEELKQAIAEFDGIALKNTATNLVFCDGNPQAKVMLVGEAPGADEDRLGKPFVGVSGQLLDRIFSHINLDRTAENPEEALYISNILSWRPPGNRTPAPAEIEVSLPFIEKHIQLIRPKLLIFCGGVSAKALLGRAEGVSRLRNTWHDYTPQTTELEGDFAPIPAIATYHPAYLLRTPAQKRAVWADMLRIQSKRRAPA